MTAALRQRRFRERRRKGIAVIPVEIGADVYNGLEIAGLCRMEDCSDSKAVSIALSKALKDWARLKKTERVTLIARGKV
jgi:hypothetical protein